MNENGYSLDLAEMAQAHFRLRGQPVSAEQQQIVSEAMRFAFKAVRAYQRLMEQQADDMREQYLQRRQMVDPVELVRVVELARCLRGRASTPGDLWAAFSYMLDRNLAEAEWQSILDELELLSQLENASR
jgi:hypothetical protein